MEMFLLGKDLISLFCCASGLEEGYSPEDPFFIGLELVRAEVEVEATGVEECPSTRVISGELRQGRDLWLGLPCRSWQSTNVLHW
jgi:hypothetical protein